MVHQDYKIEIEMKKIRNRGQYTPSLKDQETPQGKSMTIQNDTLSVSEMLRRLSAGMPLSKKTGTFGEHEDDDHDQYDFEKTSQLDLVERQEITDQTKGMLEQVKASKTRAAMKKHEAAKEAEKAAIKEALLKEIEEQKSVQN
jgi:hypothetical protein